MRAQFGSFLLDSTTRELRRDGEVVHLSIKAFDLLRQLIESRPRVVAKDAILETLWSGTHVGEGTLAAVVAELRNALCDDARQPQFIRTVHRVGYAFCCEVDQADGTPDTQHVYRLIWGGREIELCPGSNVLGREPAAIAWIDDPSISRHHALIHIYDTYVTIEDLGSKNGTFVKGRRLTESERLHDGDAITFGRVPMTFRIFRNGAPTQTVDA